MQIPGIERAPRDATVLPEEVWVFELEPTDDAESRDRFILLRQGQDPTSTQLRLSTALDRKALNRWIRDRESPLSDAQVTEADALRDRLREYSIPVAVLVADSLQDATESFKRINSSGVPMTDFNMVTALAYRDSFDPQVLFEQYRSELLEPLGWQDVPDLDILRVCAALAEQHPAKMEVDKLAGRLREYGESIIAQAFQAVAGAARTIRVACGIHGPEALPYSWQLITLAVWQSRSGDMSTPKAAEAAVRRWLWLTTYGEVFGGVNSAIYDRSVKALGDMTKGGSWKAMERDISKKVRPIVRFDFRAARSKAVALAMARHQDNDHLNGRAHRALASGVSAMGLLQASGMRSKWWHLTVIPEGDLVSQYRDALKHRAAGSPEPSDNKLLNGIGVPDNAHGSISDLLEYRRDSLKAEEQKFISELGLEWADAE